MSISLRVLALLRAFADGKEVLHRDTDTLESFGLIEPKKINGRPAPLILVESGEMKGYVITEKGKQILAENPA